MNWKYGLWRGLAEAYALAGGGRAARPGLRVLCYHAVGGDLPGDPYGLSVPAERFERQMELVASKAFGEAVSLGGALEAASKPRVSLTFDDGYMDTLTRAAPVLARLGLPFTVCVAPGLLGGPGMLTEGALKELARAPGAEIGAHGLNHLRLADCDDKALAHELSESRRRLEDLLGKPVSAMSYPHGSASRRARDAARLAGYRVAACSRYGLNGPDRDPLLLCRTEIVAWDAERAFRQKLLGGWDWYRFRHRDPMDA